jgi:hypothetical protein
LRKTSLHLSTSYQKKDVREGMLQSNSTSHLKISKTSTKVRTSETKTKKTKSLVEKPMSTFCKAKVAAGNARVKSERKGLSSTCKNLRTLVTR